MAWKKIRYNCGDGIAKIRMEDETGALVENWTLHWSDLSKWVRQMQKKYSISMKKEQERDLEWLRKS